MTTQLMIEMGKAYLADSTTAISSDSFNSLGIKHGIFLVWGLIHEAHIALLGLQYARQVNLERYDQVLNF